MDGGQVTAIAIVAIIMLGTIIKSIFRGPRHPVVFNDGLALVADETFLADEPEIAFNAGRLDRSIVLMAADYTRIFAPRLASIAVR